MEQNTNNLDYLILGVDISEKELEVIIAKADKIISDADSEREKLIEAYLNKVQYLQKLNKWNESKEFIDKLLALNPDMPEALVRLGNVYAQNNEFEKSIDCISEALNKNEKYAYGYNARGCTYGYDKDFDFLEDQKDKYKNIYDASLAIISAFAKVKGSIFLVSTHIMEVAEQLCKLKNIRFGYFHTNIKGKEFTYSYRLLDGVTEERLGMLIIENERIIETINEGS